MEARENYIYKEMKLNGSKEENNFNFTCGTFVFGGMQK